jgi:hypothetical protein
MKKRNPSKASTPPANPAPGGSEAGADPGSPFPHPVWLLTPLGLLVLVAGYFLITSGQQPRQEKPPDPLIETFAELLGPAAMPDAEKGQRPTRDAGKAQSLLTSPPREWGEKLTAQELSEMLAHHVLRDDRAVVEVLGHDSGKGVSRLRVKGVFTSPLVEDPQGPMVYSLRSPIVLVKPSEGKVQPLGLDEGTKPTGRLLEGGEAVAHRFAVATANKALDASPYLPPAPGLPEGPVSEPEADLWAAKHVLAHPSLRVVRVTSAGPGRYRLEARCKINPPPLDVREGSGRVVRSSQSRYNPDVIVEVRDGKVHAVALE